MNENGQSSLALDPVFIRVEEVNRARKNLMWKVVYAHNSWYLEREYLSWERGYNLGVRNTAYAAFVLVSDLRREGRGQ